MTLAPQEDYLGCLPKALVKRPYNNWTSPSLPVRPTIALCATESEAVHLAQAADLKIDALIALTPQAACQCYLQGIPYYKLEDFFDSTAFWDGDEPMLAMQSRWSDQVDAFIWQVVPEFREVDFRPAGSYFFFLKVVSDMLFRAVFGLAHLLIASQPRRVYYFASKKDIDDYPSHWGRETLFFNGLPYGFVLPTCAAEYGVSVTALPALPQTGPGQDAQAQQPSVTRVKSSIRWLFYALPSEWQDTLHRVRRQGLGGFRPEPKSPGGAEIISGGVYDLDRTLLEQHGFRVTPIADLSESSRRYSAHSASFDRQLADAWREVIGQVFFREPFVWCGVDLFGAAESRLHYWWHTIIPQMWQLCKQAHQRFEQQRPQAVLFYSQWRIIDFAVTAAARSLSVPVVTFQHGGFEGNCEYTTYDMTDMRQSDYRLVYGESIAAYLQARAVRSGKKCAQTIPVGSGRLDALTRMRNQPAETRKKLGVAPQETLVLYVPTSYQYDCWYMSRQSYLSVPYFDLLTKVIETFIRFPQLRFVYKPFPQALLDPIARVIAARCPNCQVTKIPMPQLLQASDAFIIDIPSTGMLEALLTDKPMLVFSDRRCVALRPEARELLGKRVLLSETPEDFLEQLKSFLNKGQFESLENPDREFLRAYGTYLDDGRSAERAVEALKAIVGGSVSRLRCDKGEGARR